MEIEIIEHEKQTIKKVVGTQIPQELYNKLKNEAQEEFMSISDLLRKIIFIYYKDKEVNGGNK